MEQRSVISAVLRTINDDSAVHPYGDGFLVDLPLTYGDGDQVRVLVEPAGDGVRVSDQAAAQERLLMADVSIEQGRAAEAMAAAIRVGGLANIGGYEDELATFGSIDELGRMILAVAQTAIRVDQLRWLAVKRSPVQFAERVASRLQRAAKRDDWQVRRNAPLRLSSGRERQVTLAVTRGDSAAYVQALSSRDYDAAAEHAFHLFSWAADKRAGHVAALAGAPGSWPEGILEELRTVANVEYFEAGASLERAVGDALAGSAASSV